MTRKHFPLAVTRPPLATTRQQSGNGRDTNPIPQPIIRTRTMFGCTVKILSTGKVNVYNGKTNEYLGFFIVKGR